MANNNILAIDCATEGFWIELESGGKRYFSKSEGEKSDLVLVAVEKLLEKANIKPADLNVIGVGVGPGSFTGIRIALSVAKGFACALPELKIVPFDSFEVLSYNVRKKGLAVIVQGYSKFVFAKLGAKKVCAEIEEVKQKIADDTNVVCKKSVFDLVQKGKHVLPNVDLIGLVKLKDKFVSVENLKPVYLRASQAEIERRKKND